MIPAPVGSFTAVDAGVNLSCAIQESTRAIECWGSSGVNLRPPVGRFTAVSADFSHACGIRDTGEITCWGSSRHTIEQSGRKGTLETGQTDAPDGIYTAISAGDSGRHHCAIREGSAITCWGMNASIHIDDAGVVQITETRQIDAPDGEFTSVSVGQAHTCAIRTSGEIVCWGADGGGQATPPTD